MSNTLARWNKLSAEDAVSEILSCCGSGAWARALVARRPLHDRDSLMMTSNEIWNNLAAQDWVEAFSKHPRIGERTAPQAATAQSAAWSEQEQRVSTTGADVQSALEAANREYELKFGRVFIVCATGKSAPEMLDILCRRLQNDSATELREAAGEQQKITNIRLEKWLSQ
jgi:2-oxo-4-hydroxy-4-carboxy-5-ureidoimidazoline decarboxylase